MSDGLSANPFNPGLKFPRALTALVGRLPWLRVLLTSDPPAHTVLRRKVSRAFTPRMISSWEERISAIASELLASPPRDLVSDLASPLPTRVIAEMMGIPASRQDDFKRWSDNLVNGLLTGGSVSRMATSAAEISAFFAATVARRKRRPGDDLVSVLVTGDALNLAELVTFCVLLLVAGNETTTNLISNTMLALFARPELCSALAADPSLAGAAVEEALRFDGPGQGLLRVATEDVTIAGVTIPAGADVMPLIASANRDPRIWEDPDTFRLDRGPMDHLAFGTGIHFCIGHALARMEGRIAIEALFSRYPGIAAGGAPVRLQSPVLRGFRSMPVTTRPGVAALG
jgi:hypothetical protein